MGIENIYTIYSEHTPNPNVLKFVSNIGLFNSTKEFFDKPNKIDFPLINLLFNFPFVVKVFLGKNFISIEKGNKLDWIEFSSEIRSFIQQKLNEGIKASTITISNNPLQKKNRKKINHRAKNRAHHRQRNKAIYSNGWWRNKINFFRKWYCKSFSTGSVSRMPIIRKYFKEWY